MKKIKDISLAEVKEGKRWQVHPPDDIDTPLEEWEIEPKDDFEPEDHVAYSAIFVTDEGDITPLIQVKQVLDLDYGGDYCEYKNGVWRQLGLEPNPNAPHGKDFVSSPLENDPSFDTNWDHRAWHRENFKKWVQNLS